MKHPSREERQGRWIIPGYKPVEKGISYVMCNLVCTHVSPKLYVIHAMTSDTN